VISMMVTASVSFSNTSSFRPHTLAA
jgi:hypothetical protein